MAVEKITLIKRTIWVSECPTCHDRVESTKKRAKERRCNTCREWVPFVETTYTGPDISHA